MLYPRKAAILYAVRGITLYCSADDFYAKLHYQLRRSLILLISAKLVNLQSKKHSNVCPIGGCLVSSRLGCFYFFSFNEYGCSTTYL